MTSQVVTNGAGVRRNGPNGHNRYENAFHINGQLYQAHPDVVPIDTTLNSFIRNYANLPGTKFMCLEGGCGACIVNASWINPFTKELQTGAINSCLTPVYSCDGMDIKTIEGIGSKKLGYHPVQKRLAEFHGTQCGYCSPGIVMNMYSLLESKGGKVTMEEIENSFGGNICRCTGYRPILDAFKSMAIDADPKYKQLCSDIEDLPKTCPKTGNSCSSSCNGLSKNEMIFNDGREWHKPHNLNDLFGIMMKISSRKYMLIAGNTAHGVYRRDPEIEVFIDVTGIEELHRSSVTENAIVLGGNINLNEAMDIFVKAEQLPTFSYCKDIRRHIDLIANVPVRNAGTLAGNLSIKHEHHEFPSDLLLLLQAVNAKIGLVTFKNNTKYVDIEEYLAEDMDKKIILNIELKPLDPARYKFKSYKIMPRAQNSHAYVNAAFLIELDQNEIVSCNLCFGGINPEFLHASKTENFLLNKNPYSSEILQETIKTLLEEIQPNYNLPDASPDFRRNLAISLFYKFILSTCPPNLLKPQIRTGGDILERPLSSGIQIFETHKDKWPITQPVQKVEAVIQCSGEAQYVNDIPHMPGELWAAFVPAKSLQKIIEIDPTEALNTPGVRHFLSAKDIPGKNNFTPHIIFIHEDEEIFVSDTPKFYGQPVGIILADTHQLACNATSMVKVRYESEEKPVIPTIKTAYDNNAMERFRDTHANLSATCEGQNIKNIIKGHFEMGGQYHFTMEPQTCVCIPGEDGLEVYSATQYVDFVQVAISQCTKIPENCINVHMRRLGGGYGAKITRPAQVACASAIACQRTSRPIRFVLSIESNMETVGKRNGVISDYEVHVDDKGKIQMMENIFREDYGCSINEDPIYTAKEFFKNCYISDTFNFTSKICVTDSASNTWCRAPGTTEGIASIETIMEHIAYETGLDAIDVRMANIAEDNKIKHLMPEFLESIDFKERKSEIDDFNAKNRWRKRGIAVVPMQYGQSFYGSIPVIVSIFHTDGTVAITHGGVECGQGINTKITQVAAHTLKIPMEYIKIKPSVNYVVPNAMGTGGSMTSEAVSFATMKACEILVERMKPVREKMVEAKWNEVTEACHNQLIELSATYQYKMTDLQAYSIWGLSCAEVEVDMLTGNYQLSRVDILEDTGESLSPQVDVGQVEGAFVMGLGYWLTENLVYDESDGKLLTNRTWNYKPPGAKDIPIDFRIKFLRNSPNSVSVLRSKATGEPAVCMSIVAIFALRYALISARKDAGITEWLSLGAPTTPEQVLLASGTTPNMLTI